MHIQPEILIAAQIPGNSLIKGHLHSSSNWDNTSYGKNGGQYTDIYSSSVVRKNSGNWNGADLVRIIILSAFL